MDSNQVIIEIRQQLEIVKNNGNDAVSIDGLDEYLETLSKNTSESKDILLAHYTAEHQLNIEKYKAKNSSWRELFKATASHAQAAIKLQALINGGAAVALLAFIGRIWSPDFSNTAIANYIAFALILFCYGVGSAALTQMFSYTSQHCFTYDLKLLAEVMRAFALSTALVSLILFFSGTYCAYLGFTQ